MRKSRILSKLIVAIVTGALMLGASTSVLAQSKDKDKDRKTKETVAMSQQVYEKLVEIQELIEAKEYAQGQIAIEELKEKKNLSDYERAQIYNLLAYSYYLQERFEEAIRAYDMVLAQPDLPEALMMSTLKTKSQLHFQQ